MAQEERKNIEKGNVGERERTPGGERDVGGENLPRQGSQGGQGPQGEQGRGNLGSQGSTIGRTQGTPGGVGQQRQGGMGGQGSVGGAQQQGRFNCQQCGATFNAQEELTKHNRASHPQ